MVSDMAADWSPSISKAAGPLYLAIADALSVDIAAGRLPVGTRLPPQRTLADRLGIDFTTVSRAYAEARKRGLVEGRVGQGTYVRARRPSRPEPSAGSGLIDMSMNLPPRFDDAVLAARMWDDIADLKTGDGLGLLMRYQEAGGSVLDKAAGAAWLAPRLGAVAPERLLVCPGAQGALLALLGSLAGPGDTVCADGLAYPGFLAVADYLRIRVVGIEMDDEGLVPEAFETACRQAAPKVLYCNPTLHNPTTSTLSLGRRERIVAIARRHRVAIIEDDAYGALPADPVPPLAALAPDLAYHVAGLAKSVSPALRVAYLVLPEPGKTAPLAGAIRATAGMASPLTAAVATQWIEDGTALAVLDAIRKESRQRQKIASGILPAELVRADPEGFHAWLALPGRWNRGDFASRLRSAGIGVVTSDAFSVSGPAPEAVRLGLGAAPDQQALAASLRAVADLLAQPPGLSSMVV
ncbi:GntR family transcriptional regulator [Mesorhizobium sp. L-8-10]|uniref:aminotransferase-like domain-containing protein n=2 Tax=Mesorhizobium sp. L-8-10 TaxID=2744523 RepID=UPI001927A9DC|nr:PLP-dependent aminotransferase family protein [Mesorhizobium sp. L-8-10]BCH28889.1 GntR family transcriptional regulator [Mesorhizobium sp. L-8-10]